MREIKLTNGGATIVDDDVFEILSQWKWKEHKGYVRRNSTRKGVTIYFAMHRVITNCPEGMLVDHVNGDPMDNRKCNLRICTPSQNMRNMRTKRTNKSGFKGVTLDLRSGKYRATIRDGFKALHLGLFDTPDQAHEAYCLKAKEISGEFANFGASHD